ncbi:phosphotransferase enzyme family protein [Microlunatus speluncae]|uniref:phosphotransferase enzyme family protein n=1 Tax=Microlunatus speluncae TaxID=2594267 RepID=UPI001266682D|nr:phosphotransferase [Microlunatus speluncae]
MESRDELDAVLAEWRTLLGDHPTAEKVPHRGLWWVTAADDRRYVLKRLGPWRNLPLADEARVLRHLSTSGVLVAEFLITERAALLAHPAEHPYVLMPLLPNDPFTATELVDLEERIGAAVAHLHRALASYPWPANSYRERLIETVQGELRLPTELHRSFARCREALVAVLAEVPLQLVHGDLTPGNVLVRRPGQVSGFIDFDHLPLAPRVWDLGKYLSRRFRRTGREAAFTPAEGLRHVVGFLRGYQKISPLSAAELAAVPLTMIAGNVIEASYFQQILSGELDRRRLPDHEEVLRDSLEAARWQLAELAAIRSAVIGDDPEPAVEF